MYSFNKMCFEVDNLVVNARLQPNPTQYVARKGIMLEPGFQNNGGDKYLAFIDPTKAICNAPMPVATTDGASGSNVARDAYNLVLNYYDQDYQPIGSGLTSPSMLIGANLGGLNRPLYNGNISSMGVNIPKLGTPLLYNYQYDQLNRLVGMDAWKSNSNWSNLMPTEDYKEKVTYDPNGNILSYFRNGTTIGGTPIIMDSLQYAYKLGTNQLDHVKDAVPANNYSIDIDNQDTLNYTYDQIGNLKKDKAEGIDTIIWTVYGKIAKIVKSNGIIINYTYDASGNRISKVVGKKVTWYVRDASGNVMSVYSKDDSTNSGHLMQSEVHLYGSSRLGIWESERDMQDTAILLQNGMIMFKRDKKRYELNNHLGNVLVTVSDRKIPISYNGTTIDHYEAYVMNAQDFYPFGMVMVGRGYVKSVGYRYGFGTQERSTEINENSYTAEFWQYDARIGRRWNTDKRPNVSISPYNCFAGNPIWYNDIKGDTITGENGFDKAAYRAGLVEHIDLLKKYKKDGLPGGMAVNEKNLNGKLNEMNAALNTFDALEARKDIIVVRKGDAATNPNEAWTNFNIAQNAPRVDIGTGVKDADFYLISHELQHVEDYFNGGFSFAANGAGGILVDIYDEIGPNNRQEVLRSGIIAASPNPTVWTNKTLPNRVFSDGTTPYNVLPKDKRVLSDPKWSSFLKTETAKSVQENTPQPHFYVGFEKDRADAEAAKKAEEAKKK